MEDRRDKGKHEEEKRGGEPPKANFETIMMTSNSLYDNSNTLTKKTHFRRGGVCKCACVYRCRHECRCLQRPEGDPGSSGAGVTDGSKLPSEDAGRTGNS